MKKALFFDYGGTLDTNGLHWSEVLWEGYCEAKVAVDYNSFREAYVYGERTLEDSALIVETDTFKDVLQKKVTLQLQYLQQEPEVYRTEIVAYCDGVARKTTTWSKKILEQLKGRYKLILVSNFYGNLATVLRDYDLFHLFDDVVESSVVGVRKPNPEIFSLAMLRNGLCAEECVVIGDSLKNDINAACSLQVDGIWLNGKGWELHDASKDFHGTQIKSLEEVLTLL